LGGWVEVGGFKDVVGVLRRGGKGVVLGRDEGFMKTGTWISGVQEWASGCLIPQLLGALSLPS
jgi:hypothetical protein